MTYFMTGPDGDKHAGYWEITAVDEPRSFEFDDGFAIVKMRPPQEAIGFTLEQSQIRSKYGVTVVGVKAPGQDFTYAVPSTKVSAHDTLIVSGATSLLERLAARP